MSECSINGADDCGTGINYAPTVNPGDGQVIPVNPGPTVSDVIDQLANVIEFSHLAQSLRERIAIITDLEVGLNQINTLVATDNSVMAQQLIGLRDDLTAAVGYINSQLNIQVSERAVLVNSVNQTVAYLNDQLSAALQEETTVRATQTGALFAEKTVKTDLAGNVSGYGLSAYADPTQAVSEFRVAADRFSIAPPAYVSSTPPPSNQLHVGKVWRDTTTNTTKWWNGTAWQTTPVKEAQPFVYLTTPLTLSDGTIVQPGLYVNSAKITKLTAGQIDTRGLTIKDAQGNVILGSGTGLNWSNVTGFGKPADNATRNQIFRQVSAPTGGTYTIGDIWIDTDSVPTNVHNWNGSSWVIVSNYTNNTNQLTDGAGLGNTAVWNGITGTGKPQDNATNNMVYRQSIAPTGTHGDIWINTGVNPQIEYINVNGTWQVASNFVSNTNQITDGAGLGTTATWGGVSSKPYFGTMSGRDSVFIGSDVRIWNPTQGWVNLNTGDFVNTLSKITSGNIANFMGPTAITEAYIGNAAISNAKIQTASVDTLKIQGNAVTIPVGSYAGGMSASVSMSIPNEAAYQPVVLIATWYYQRISWFRGVIRRNGVTIFDRRLSRSFSGVNPYMAITATYIDYPPPGWTTYTLSGYYDGDSTGSIVETEATALYAILAKR